MWLLFLHPEIDPGPPVLGKWRLSPWTTRDAPDSVLTPVASESLLKASHVSPLDFFLSKVVWLFWALDDFS